jgi:hypothetical protein
MRNGRNSEANTRRCRLKNKRRIDFMKKLIMAILVIAVGSGLYAQSYTPPKVGTVLTYANNDAKGAVQDYSQITVKDVKGSGNNMTITFAGVGLDKSRKPVKGTDFTYKLEVKNGIVVMDLNQLLPAEMKNQGIKMDIKGTPMELPSNLKAGQSLKPYEATITMDISGIKMTSKMKYEGKCAAIEDLKVPAGTFKCHKVNEKITTNVMNMTNTGTSTSWWAASLGFFSVKTETYDEKNKLASSQVLIEVKGK